MSNKDRRVLIVKRGFLDWEIITQQIHGTYSKPFWGIVMDNNSLERVDNTFTFKGAKKKAARFAKVLDTDQVVYMPNPQPQYRYVQVIGVDDEVVEKVIYD